jgi:hypothetical protein
MAKEAMSKALYGVHPGVATAQKWISELPEKTGRSLEEWIALAKREGPKEEKARREWLKTKHKIVTNSAWWISERVDGKGAEADSPEEYLKTAVLYVEDQYAGAKEKLRSVYLELLRLGKSMGEDVKACPCKTMVPCIASTCLHRSSRRRIRGLIWDLRWRATEENFRRE